MQLIRPDININFVGARYKALALSTVLILIGVAAYIYRGGLPMGVDFAGGTLIQIQFKQPTTPDAIRSALKDLAGASSIQQIGAASDHEYLIRTELITSELQSLSGSIEERLDDTFGKDEASVRRVEMVGPKVGADLRQKALFAVYYALLLMAIYVSGRFEFKWVKSGIMAGVLVFGVYLLEIAGLDATILILAALVVTLVLCWFLELPYALGALLSLLHDVLIVVGAFALAGKEFTLEVLAAILTIVGFSINDTIIIFDRVRENLRKDKKQDIHALINTSVNQTLSRTILTSGTVFLVTVCLFVFGGTVIHDFAFAMLVGIITGTYSTVFVASLVVIAYYELKGRKKVARRAEA
ncbi:MAG: protein translocase subunit SecF [Deltaproteobacteria bacterium]|nr:protein translocase subunit SecF [Deltaproteobacteria bacterium]